MMNGARRLTHKVADEFRFLKAWAGNPLTTGAVAPSGPHLTKAMAAAVEAERDGPVIELGPGTGVMTEAMLARGIPQERIVMIEYSADFCKLLRERFPRVTVIQGDAYAIRETLGHPAPGSVASVVSSLPLFTRPPAARRGLIGDAMELLAPGAPFIQFSYALVPPVPAESGRFSVSPSPWILRNVPPARVWTYRGA
ncbi:methyltransferase domain-containing protein [Pseudoxanthobacter sp.]|uniref:class I SAM-dependent methyltransferase n=1 Tax=Pseudoxanthobacter sp. TaxID=1925742 RepID=UPI002FE0B215